MLSIQLRPFQTPTLIASYLYDPAAILPKSSPSSTSLSRPLLLWPPTAMAPYLYNPAAISPESRKLSLQHRSYQTPTSRAPYFYNPGLLQLLAAAVSPESSLTSAALSCPLLL